MTTRAQQSKERHLRRKKRVRARITGTAEKPRLAVYRSNANTYAQLVDDVRNITLASAHDMKEDKGTKTERAKLVGTAIAKKAQDAGITEAVFDRGGFRYMGRVQNVAEGAREAGLKF